MHHVQGKSSHDIRRLFVVPKRHEPLARGLHFTAPEDSVNGLGQQPEYTAKSGSHCIAMTRQILRRAFLAALLSVLTAGLAAARAEGPALAVEAQRYEVTAADYRLTLDRYRSAWNLELRPAGGGWHAALREHSTPEFAVNAADKSCTTGSTPARLRVQRQGDCVAVGMTTVAGTGPVRLEVHFVCAAEGVLVRSRMLGPAQGPRQAWWPLPRLMLDQQFFDRYAYWRESDQLRSGRLADLGSDVAYVGVSCWGRQGDTAAALSSRHPAVVAQSTAGGTALAVVTLGSEAPHSPAPPASPCFLQRHTPSHLYFYTGIGDAGQTAGPWAWLAPLHGEPAAYAKQVEQLLRRGQEIVGRFRPLAPEPDPEWGRPVPDFPAALRNSRPVDDIARAMVYSVHETINDDQGMALARKVGSDVLIRAWFKWHTALDYSRQARHVAMAHGMGALLGGGITCSALYDGENGLTPERLSAMATRGPAGQLVDAWGEHGCRHGSLSSAAYREYLLHWCRQQVDAGADYLFMDEINAALGPLEGYDDDSVRDFCEYLVQRYCGPEGWSPADARWLQTFKIDLQDAAICPDGSVNSFRYREYLARHKLAQRPVDAKNPLVSAWHSFRQQRDDRAWKWLSDAVRAYATAHGRRVLLSGNGLARYVDLQVLGVWDNWRTAHGSVDLSESQLDAWRSTVAGGWALARRRVPVVLFHDWGFNGFPWMEVSPDDRKLWMRVRGAEIYAAGGFFAFPVHGPSGADAERDGTLGEIVRQTTFYRQHADLYLGGQLLTTDGLETREPLLSLALGRSGDGGALLLHVINRQTHEGQLTRRSDVAVEMPLAAAPDDVRIVSPDWSGEKRGTARLRAGKLEVVLPELEAYDVALLRYAHLPEVAAAGRKIVLPGNWARPEQNEFVVDPDGTVHDAWALCGMLQGRLHAEMRNPPTLSVNLPRGGTLRVHVQAVALPGARLQYSIDGRVVQTVDLPDRDGKNDSAAREYDQTLEFAIPAGRHRVTLDNTGGDWVRIAWLAVDAR